jgi:uncharacterized protein YwgA
MTTYDIVHLLLYAAGEIQGRTKLQKLVYFTAALSKLPGSLGYRAHYFGPYSPEVAAAVDDLRGLGFLEQRVVSRGSLDSQGFEVARYDYTLTDAGKQIAEEKTKEHPADWLRIKAAVETLQKAKAEDYVKLSIAAKAYYMLIEKGSPATLDELHAMTPNFGWTVTREQMTEAGELLKSVGLITLANP